MRINVRSDSVEVEGYVNAIERNSKPLNSRIGKFIERIRKGAFSNALKRNDDVHILLNHNWSRDLGSTKQGNLELTEDAIGLHARATITDKEVIDMARNGDLVGWSFGFQDVPDGVEETRDQETGFPMRLVKDLSLAEVSILDRSRTPAYDGTLLMARSDDVIEYHGEAMLDEITVTVEEETQVRQESEPEQNQQAMPDEHKEIDYSEYDAMIKEMKGESA